jgi:hypothetical protein
MVKCGSRRVSNAVLLENLRCDGSVHEGCQSEFRIFWKEASLRKAAQDAWPTPLRRAGGLRASLTGNPLEGRERPMPEH